MALLDPSALEIFLASTRGFIPFRTPDSQMASSSAWNSGDFLTK